MLMWESNVDRNMETRAKCLLCVHVPCPNPHLSLLSAAPMLRVRKQAKLQLNQLLSWGGGFCWAGCPGARGAQVPEWASKKLETTLRDARNGSFRSMKLLFWLVSHLFAPMRRRQHEGQQPDWLTGGTTEDQEVKEPWRCCNWSHWG